MSSRELWASLIQRSVSPMDWFLTGFDEDRLSGGDEDELPDWVFRSITWDLYLVGYYDKHDTWVTDSSYKTPEEAAKRVRTLRGTPW